MLSVIFEWFLRLAQNKHTEKSGSVCRHIGKNVSARPSFRIYEVGGFNVTLQELLKMLFHKITKQN
jgi:hypothetical protein